MSRLAILQPSFLPWLGYFDQIIKSDTFVFYDDVQYDKNGWRNRNKIKNNEGKEQWLTIPVVTKGLGFPPINEVKIDRTKKWKKQHLGTIRQFYKRTPFFDLVFKDINAVYSSRSHTYLIEIIDDFFEFTLGYLDIRTKIYKSSSLNIEKSGKIQRILDIADRFSANIYLSGNAAASYLSQQDLIEHGIKLEWHDYTHPSYKQINGDFLSHLSIIDLLFNIGPEARQVLNSAR